jgi:hypothetical protein
LHERCGPAPQACDSIRGNARATATEKGSLPYVRFIALIDRLDLLTNKGLRPSHPGSVYRIFNVGSYRMNEVKVAQRFAVAGFLISIFFFLFWKLEDKLNFFHLPTNTAVAGNYTEPAFRSLLVKLNFVFCPPYILTSFAGMDLGTTANLILWAISLALNALLYFIVGLVFGALWNEWARFRKP